MKKIFLVTLTLLAAFNLNAQTKASRRISIQSAASAPLNAGTIPFQFVLFDEITKKTLRDQDLVNTHTKKLHVMAFDASLNEFNHVHPTYDGSKWNVDLEFPVNGKYFIWAQGQLQNGDDFSSFITSQVQGGKKEITPAPLGDHRKASDLGTILELANTPIRAGKMVTLNFKVLREDGVEPELTPYLGAFAHVIAVTFAGDQLIHVHPMQGKSANTGMLHALFPTAGDYRVWIQLVDKGELKTIPLSITVLK